MIAPKDDNASPRKKPALPADRPGAFGPSPAANRFVWIFGVFMVVIAGGGFLFKLIEFIATIRSNEPMQFAVMPVLTYLIVAAGFGCLFMWAYMSGQFKNIEGPKYRMLDMQKEFDEEEESH